MSAGSCGLHLGDNSEMRDTGVESYPRRSATGKSLRNIGSGGPCNLPPGAGAGTGPADSGLGGLGDIEGTAGGDGDLNLGGRAVSDSRGSGVDSNPGFEGEEADLELVVGMGAGLDLGGIEADSDPGGTGIGSNFGVDLELGGTGAGSDLGRAGVAVVHS